MSVDDYREAKRQWSDRGLEPLISFPQTADRVEVLEQALSVKLPQDYRQMLEDFGLLMIGDLEINGIGKDGVLSRSPAGIVRSTERRREAGLISETMVEIMSSGYGPVFVLDCAKAAETGEAPVLMVPLEGYRSPDVKTVAESFGAFLLAEVRASLERGGASKA